MNLILGIKDRVIEYKKSWLFLLLDWIGVFCND